MELCLLLLLPLLIGLGGLIFGKGKINWKEFLVQEAAVLILVGVGFWLGRCSQTRDVEVWSGEVVKKAKVRVPCRHSYPCNPHPCMCDDKGNCSTCWDTCYEHSYDNDWNVYDSAQQVYTIATVDRQGLMEPPRWTQVRRGDPTASTHVYTNYIKGSPWTIIKRTGAAGKYIVPAYPRHVRDYYHVDRFVSKVAVPDGRTWKAEVAKLNGRLGPKKEVNVILLVTDAADSEYVHAVEEAWLGGKKNDFIVILGVPTYPQIAWVRSVSWTRSEDLKVAVRDRIQEIGTLEKRDAILAVLDEEISSKFVRRPMEDFAYLNAEIRPPLWALLLIGALGILVSVGLTGVFYIYDPFGGPARGRTVGRRTRQWVLPH